MSLAPPTVTRITSNSLYRMVGTHEGVVADGPVSRGGGVVIVDAAVVVVVTARGGGVFAVDAVIVVVVAVVSGRAIAKVSTGHGIPRA